MQEEPKAKPPEATDSPGSEAGQVAAASAAVVVSGPVTGGLPATPLTGVIRDLQDAGVRGQGGMMLLGALASRVETESQDLRAENRQLRTELQDARTSAAQADTRVAVLTERLANLRHSQPLSALLLTIGGTAFGIAYPYLLDGKKVAWIVASIAVLLMVVGWWTPRRERRD